MEQPAATAPASSPPLSPTPPSVNSNNPFAGVPLRRPNQHQQQQNAPSSPSVQGEGGDGLGAMPSRVHFMTSVHAIRNGRRKMEDRHVLYHELNAVCDLKTDKLYSYFAIFDGHAGVDAANFAAEQLHLNLVRSASFAEGYLAEAFVEAFSETDLKYLEKSARDGTKSGSTAVVCLIEQDPKEDGPSETGQTLKSDGSSTATPRRRVVHFAWLGDSQAILVKNGNPYDVTPPHKPDSEEERQRIEELGGAVLYLDTWRVNGTLAVSRAIGDPDYKPYVSSTPGIESIPLTGEEDFIVIACDGLWDNVTPEEATTIVYEHLSSAAQANSSISEAASNVSEVLTVVAQKDGSQDNITTIVVFLKDPEQLVAQPFRPPSPRERFVPTTSHGDSGSLVSQHLRQEQDVSAAEANQDSIVTLEQQFATTAATASSPSSVGLASGLNVNAHPFSPPTSPPEQQSNFEQQRQQNFHESLQFLNLNNNNLSSTTTSQTSPPDQVDFSGTSDIFVSAMNSFETSNMSTISANSSAQFRFEDSLSPASYIECKTTPTQSSKEKLPSNFEDSLNGNLHENNHQEEVENGRSSDIRDEKQNNVADDATTTDDSDLSDTDSVKEVLSRMNGSSNATKSSALTSFTTTSETREVYSSDLQVEQELESEVIIKSDIMTTSVFGALPTTGDSGAVGDQINVDETIKETIKTNVPITVASDWYGESTTNEAVDNHLSFMSSKATNDDGDLWATSTMESQEESSDVHKELKNENIIKTSTDIMTTSVFGTLPGGPFESNKEKSVEHQVDVMSSLSSDWYGSTQTNEQVKDKQLFTQISSFSMYEESREEEVTKASAPTASGEVNDEDNFNLQKSVPVAFGSELVEEVDFYIKREETSSVAEQEKNKDTDLFGGFENKQNSSFNEEVDVQAAHSAEHEGLAKSVVEEISVEEDELEKGIIVKSSEEKQFVSAPNNVPVPSPSFDFSKQEEAKVDETPVQAETHEWFEEDIIAKGHQDEPADEPYAQLVPALDVASSVIEVIKKTEPNELLDEHDIEHETSSDLLSTSNLVGFESSGEVTTPDTKETKQDIASLNFASFPAGNAKFEGLEESTKASDVNTPEPLTELPTHSPLSNVETKDGFVSVVLSSEAEDLVQEPQPIRVQDSVMARSVRKESKQESILDELVRAQQPLASPGAASIPSVVTSPVKPVVTEAIAKKTSAPTSKAAPAKPGVKAAVTAKKPASGSNTGSTAPAKRPVSATAKVPSTTASRAPTSRTTASSSTVTSAAANSRLTSVATTTNQAARKPVAASMTTAKPLASKPAARVAPPAKTSATMSSRPASTLRPSGASFTAPRPATSTTARSGATKAFNSSVLGISTVPTASSLISSSTRSAVAGVARKPSTTTLSSVKTLAAAKVNGALSNKTSNALPSSKVNGTLAGKSSSTIQSKTTTTVRSTTASARPMTASTRAPTTNKSSSVAPARVAVATSGVVKRNTSLTTAAAASKKPATSKTASGAAPVSKSITKVTKTSESSVVTSSESSVATSTVVSKTEFAVTESVVSGVASDSNKNGQLQLQLEQDSSFVLEEIEQQ